MKKKTPLNTVYLVLIGLSYLRLLLNNKRSNSIRRPSIALIPFASERKSVGSVIGSIVVVLSSLRSLKSHLSAELSFTKGPRSS